MVWRMMLATADDSSCSTQGSTRWTSNHGYRRWSWLPAMLQSRITRAGWDFNGFVGSSISLIQGKRLLSCFISTFAIIMSWIYLRYRQKRLEKGLKGDPRSSSDLLQKIIRRLTLDPHTNPWTTKLQTVTGYKPSELKDCVTIILHDLQLNRKGSSYMAIRDKYKQNRFKGLSALLPPVEIPASYFKNLKE